eukprot:8888175-Heterocapsa_arctica.AAC.1
MGRPGTVHRFGALAACGVPQPFWLKSATIGLNGVGPRGGGSWAGRLAGRRCPAPSAMAQKGARSRSQSVGRGMDDRMLQTVAGHLAGVWQFGGKMAEGQERRGEIYRGSGSQIAQEGSVREVPPTEGCQKSDKEGAGRGGKNLSQWGLGARPGSRIRRTRGEQGSSGGGGSVAEKSMAGPPSQVAGKLAEEHDLHSEGTVGSGDRGPEWGTGGGPAARPEGNRGQRGIDQGPTKDHPERQSEGHGGSARGVGEQREGGGGGRIAGSTQGRQDGGSKGGAPQEGHGGTAPRGQEGKEMSEEDKKRPVVVVEMHQGRKLGAKRQEG